MSTWVFLFVCCFLNGPIIRDGRKQETRRQEEETSEGYVLTKCSRSAVGHRSDSFTDVFLSDQTQMSL